MSKLFTNLQIVEGKTEFDKLCEMLDAAKIPYERDADPITQYHIDMDNEPIQRIFYGKYQGDANIKLCTCVVIYGTGTVGYPFGFLELHGLLTPEELEYNDYSNVLGYLQAKDIFWRIEKHYKETVCEVDHV